MASQRGGGDLETPDGPVVRTWHSMLGARIGEQSYKVPASHTGGPEKKTKTNNRERERTQDNFASL